VRIAIGVKYTQPWAASLGTGSGDEQLADGVSGRVMLAAGPPSGSV
jgi:hypothetical protein